jgi:hypothetical protein
MRLVPLPGRREDAWHDEIDAALHGVDHSSAGQAWRDLREDVRALAPPMDADFERLLAERVAQWTADARPQPDDRPSRRPTRRRSRRLRLPSGRLRTAGLLASTVCTVAIAGAVAVSLQRGGNDGEPVARSVPAGPIEAPQATATTPSGRHHGVAKGTASRFSEEKASASANAAGASAGAEGEVSAPGHVQQLTASVSLTSEPEGVQSLADRVARLTVSDGGFVQSSQVAQQARGASEATLDLQVPSAKLASALASLARLAPIRAESQSSQDITSEYDAARRNLADAVAERHALLQALSRAVTQGQIESLRQQISLAAGTITRAQAAVRTVSHQASTSALEVTVVGDAHAQSLTLSRGLHDAGRVLTIALIVALVGCAVVVPLAVLCLGLVAIGRAWRRHLRERALT